MLSKVHADATEPKWPFFVALHFLFIELIAAFDDGLVVVEIVKICKNGVGEEPKFDSVEQSGSVFLTRVVAPADIVGWEAVEVLLGEGEIAERMGWVGHDI